MTDKREDERPAARPGTPEASRRLVQELAPDLHRIAAADTESPAPGRPEQRQEPRLQDWHRVRIRPLHGAWPGPRRSMGSGGGVMVEPQDSQPKTARLLDVSASGARLLIHTTEILPVDLVLDAPFLRAAGLPEIMARVVWQRVDEEGISSGLYCGVELLNLSADNRRRIREMINAGEE